MLNVFHQSYVHNTSQGVVNPLLHSLRRTAPPPVWPSMSLEGVWGKGYDPDKEAARLAALSHQDCQWDIEVACGPNGLPEPDADTRRARRGELAFLLAINIALSCWPVGVCWWPHRDREVCAFRPPVPVGG